MRIMVVDDEDRNLQLLDAVLSSQGYAVSLCRDGETALAQLEKEKIDLVLLDIMMPGLSGFEVARQIKKEKKIPVIFLTALREREDLVEALKSGGDEVLSKPFLADELLLRVKNILQLKRYQDTLEEMVAKRTKKLAKAFEWLAGSSRETVFRLLVAAEYRDDQTGGHIVRVGKTCQIIARGLALGKRFVEEIESTAQMHDLGKIGIPDRILLKPGKLSPEEFERIKEHTTIGARILEQSRFHLIRMAHDIALSHHERWDGTGYPGGARGTAIPIAGRIVALADVLDALLSDRPYKPAFSWERSQAIVSEGGSSHFDPEVVRVFLDNSEAIRKVYQNHV